MERFLISKEPYAIPEGTLHNIPSELESLLQDTLDLPATIQNLPLYLWKAMHTDRGYGIMQDFAIQMHADYFEMCYNTISSEHFVEFLGSDNHTADYTYSHFASLAFTDLILDCLYTLEYWARPEKAVPVEEWDRELAQQPKKSTCTSDIVNQKADISDACPITAIINKDNHFPLRLLTIKKDTKDGTAVEDFCLNQLEPFILWIGGNSSKMHEKIYSMDAIKALLPEQINSLFDAFIWAKLTAGWLCLTTVKQLQLLYASENVKSLPLQLMRTISQFMPDLVNVPYTFSVATMIRDLIQTRDASFSRYNILSCILNTLDMPSTKENMKIVQTTIQTSINNEAIAEKILIDLDIPNYIKNIEFVLKEVHSESEITPKIVKQLATILKKTNTRKFQQIVNQVIRLVPKANWAELLLHSFDFPNQHEQIARIKTILSSYGDDPSQIDTFGDQTKDPLDDAGVFTRSLACCCSPALTFLYQQLRGDMLRVLLIKAKQISKENYLQILINALNEWLELDQNSQLIVQELRCLQYMIKTESENKNKWRWFSELQQAKMQAVN